MAAAEQEKLRKRLEALLKLPGNQICCDCKKRGPRWASVSLGVFMCIDCSGIHRNLGVHISFVRSVNLDSWTATQVDFIEEWGNARANLYYEANMPAHVSRPKDGDSVRVIEKFIRDKYEHKKYVSKTVPPKEEKEEEKEEGHLKKAVITRQRPNISSPAPIAVPAPVAAPSLIDFMDFNDDPAPSRQAPLVPSHAPPAAPLAAHSHPVASFSPAFAPTPAFTPSYTQQAQQVQQAPAAQWAQPQQAPQHTQQHAPQHAPHQAVGFIDFGDFVSPVSTQPQQQPQQQQFVPQQQQHQQLFPQQNVPQNPPQNASGFFPSTSEAPPPVPAMPPKPQASADAILSLYASIPPPPAAGTMTAMGGMSGSNGISAMGGMGPYGGNMGGSMMQMPGQPQMGFSPYGQPQIQQHHQQGQQGHSLQQQGPGMMMPQQMGGQMGGQMGQNMGQPQQQQMGQMGMMGQQGQQQQQQQQQQQPQMGMMQMGGMGQGAGMGQGQGQQPHMQQQYQPQQQQQQFQPQQQQQMQQQYQQQQPQQQGMHMMGTSTQQYY